ncbi:metalloregulator ArsR/SmtB family transcription factor [Cocleimonas sp. KMM 6892]|uniref:ArsR/SmtB family transcription factor n=1 Tax=unclassified Cocleimonas TaxID=2639732 RepID=UPI002DB62D86|nr:MULTISPECIES: metalloregulator ArsR/SmtB family transcription factor [unclassified Cocleimonas]MEB8431179.1 metalloregulator ArsR/SmtB family transcription factor [Cocleimonas sp. KMM 6892]MEC4714049.1 metalloregulator ArsR/SmtB family transcription factor [Cocleimonas sp. KMM 6895]MEC4743380.1 metalloregulator ArsR/SmtB family transcription factor [Cocleimonas sp. KMM 6896]
MTDKLQQSFKALADPSRREILLHLSKQDMTIKEVSEHFDMTRAAVKKHLTILQQGNLISIEKSGRERINSLKPEGLKTVTNWMAYFDSFWDQKLNNLQQAMTNYTQEKDQKKK